MRIAGRGAAAVLAAVLALVLLPVGPASAASAGWADLSLEGSANDWSGTLRQRAEGFPAARITSDSAGGSAVGRQSGASTFLPATTEVGRRYGSSRGRPYLNLRPHTANGSGVPGSSTTTYAFDAPTPATGWTFVLGDVDADQVTVSATGPDSRPVAIDDLGFRSAFSACGVGSCSGDDVPRWDDATGTLVGNALALDTNGASAWFEPAVPLSTLTFVFTRRAGFPVYQTWFAALSHRLSGTVDAPGDRAEGLTVRLFAPDGRQVGETTTDADGRYAFRDLATYDGYRVALVRPAGLVPVGPLTREVDLGRDDQVADFALRAVRPVAVSGTVRDADGTGVPGVVVRLTGPGPDRTVVTGADGGYVVDDVAVGDGWTLTAEAPEATSVSGPRRFTVPPDSEEPITDQDFTLTPDPRGSASGTVRAEDGTPVPGTRVVVTDAAGVERDAVTDADGRWSVADLPPGRSTATVVPPAQTSVVGDRTRDFTVPARGGSVAGPGFVLRVPPAPTTYTAGGRVTTTDGSALADVRVSVRDPDGQPYATVRSDDDGRWEVDGLLPAPGWSAQVRPPGRYTVVGPGTQTFAVTDADVAGLDFVLERRTTGSGGSGTGSTSSGSGSGSGETLAPTGGPGPVLPLLGALAVAVGTAVLARRRRVNAD